MSLDIAGQEKVMSEPRWLAAYTRSRQEKIVASHLQQQGLPFLLPLYDSYHRWSDRVQRVRLPLFPGYVFVQANQCDRTTVLRTRGVVHIVSRAGRPCSLTDAEVNFLRGCAERPSHVEPHPFLAVGSRVRIKHGPFAGCEGILIQKKNATRVVVTINQIMQSVALNVHVAEIVAVA